MAQPEVKPSPMTASSGYQFSIRSCASFYLSIYFEVRLQPASHRSKEMEEAEIAP